MLLLKFHLSAMVSFFCFSLVAGPKSELDSVLKEWTVFTFVNQQRFDHGSGINTIPDSLPGVKTAKVIGKKVVSSAEGLIDFSIIAGGHKNKAVAYAMSVIKSDKDKFLRIGASADWWMEWQVNGKTVFSTLARGNKFSCSSAYDYIFDLPLKKGNNLVSVKVLSGSGGWKLYAGTNDEIKSRKPFIMKKASDYLDKPFDYITDENTVRKYTLPELLTTNNGQKITTSKDWMESRRGEILELFNKYVYGAIPRKFDGVEFKVSENADYIPGKISMKTVTITVKNQGKSFSFPLYVYLPKGKESPSKVFLLINNRFRSGDELRHDNPFTPIKTLIDSGYAFAMFDSKFIARDYHQKLYPGIMEIFPKEASGPEGFGVVSAWAFAVLRAVDYLSGDSAIDSSGIIVIGHSRGGKTALWSAANDSRIACACSNDSGCTGAAIARRKCGETIEAINKGFPYWFNRNYKKFNDREDELPVDQHMLMALIAPRNIQVGSALEDSWADPKGEYLSLIHAVPVYQLFGFQGIPEKEKPVLDQLVLGDHMSYHIRQGGHNLTELDWMLYLKGVNHWFKRQ